MKAMVFAAGMGTRLKPFTDAHPKALAPVAGVPILAHVVQRLKAAGVDEIVVNVHHFADQIRQFIAANNGFGLKMHISDESDLLLDTGGGLLQARQWLDGDEPFIVHNADILTDVSLPEMLAQHRAADADATLLVMPRQTARMLYFDKSDGRLQGWNNSATGECRPEGFAVTPDLQPLAFSGVHVLSPTILARLETYSEAAVFSITPFYVDNASTLDIRAFVADPGKNIWLDIGRPENLERAQALALNNSGL